MVQLGVDFLHLVTFRLGVYPQGGVIISAESQVRLDILHAAYHDVIIRVQLERAERYDRVIGEEMELDPVLYLIGPDSEQQAGLAFPVLEIKAGVAEAITYLPVQPGAERLLLPVFILDHLGAIE